MRILAVDPGESNGWCILELQPDKRIKLINYGTDKKMDFYSRLSNLTQSIDYDVIVAEDFKVRPGYAKQGAFDWNRMPAPQVLGVLEFLSVVHKIPFVLQQPSLKPPGYGFLGKPYVKGAKNAHHWDALAHGMFYLVTKQHGIPNDVLLGTK
jgi:hypothetical protein